MEASDATDREMDNLGKAGREYDEWARSTPLSLQHQHGGRHYKDLAIQPAEYNHKNKIPFCAAEAIKYLTRHEFKNGEEDVRKAMHFCQMIMEFDYGIPTKVLYGDEALDTTKSRDEDS